jgi:hypothetical protein
MRSETDQRPTLPRRDIILLPLTGLVTVLFLVTMSEICARIFWPAQESEPCLTADHSLGYRFRSNCSSRAKLVESPWVENQYNECGYRSRESCGPKKPGSIRISVLGSSFSYGYMVQYEQTYTTRASQELTRQCGRLVEFMNLGVESYSIVQTYRRTDEALALKPDLLLLAIATSDINPVSPKTLAQRNEPDAPAGAEDPEHQNWFRTHIAKPLKESRAIVVLQHFLYSDPHRFLNLYLLHGVESDYLRTPPAPAILAGIEQFDIILRDMAGKARRAGVPLIILIGPSAPQVALLNSEPRAGEDPREFPRLITGLAAKYGAGTIDPLPKMGNLTNPMELFYAANGHMNALGQQILADAVDDSLRASAIPAFSSCKAHGVSAIRGGR